MILTCPSCSTRYFAEDSTIGPNGRAVRCGRCNSTWFVEGRLDLGAAAVDAPAAARPGQLDRLRQAARNGAAAPVGAGSSASRLRAQQQERERRERANAAMMMWGAAGVAAIGAGVGAVGLREDVVQVWPETASAYAALGLGVNLYGLEINDLTVAQEFEGGETVYVVRGAVTNIGGEDKPAPLLRFGLRDSAAAEIHHQLADLQGRTVPAGGRLTFAFRLDGPVDRAADLEATFENPTMNHGQAQAPQPAVNDPTATLQGDGLDTVLKLDDRHALSSDAEARDTPAGGVDTMGGLRGGLNRG